MHTLGPAQVNTLRFQLFTFRRDPKDFKVLKSNTSICFHGLEQERHHNDIKSLTAALSCLLAWDILQNTRAHLGPRQRTGGFVEEEGEASSVEEDEDFHEREAERASSDEYYPACTCVSRLAYSWNPRLSFVTLGVKCTARY
ncbi:hypothetical protein NQZ68_019754 [Dissostichus eleginoides]|nr:hypothetical protein NQZ68_019754 [Dissostichus eleginoides]